MIDAGNNIIIVVYRYTRVTLLQCNKQRGANWSWKQVGEINNSHSVYLFFTLKSYIMRVSTKR